MKIILVTLQDPTVYLVPELCLVHPLPRSAYLAARYACWVHLCNALSSLHSDSRMRTPYQVLPLIDWEMARSPAYHPRLHPICVEFGKCLAMICLQQAALLTLWALLSCRGVPRLMWWLGGLLTAQELLTELGPDDLPPDRCHRSCS